MTRSAGGRCTSGLSALTILAVLVTPPGASGQVQGGGKGLGIKLKTGGPAAVDGLPELSLAVPAGATASTFLVLENTSDRKVEGLKILGHLFPAAGQPALAPAVAIKRAGAEMPAAGWTIEPGKSLFLTLTVSNVDPSAASEGWLVGSRDDVEYELLARLKLERTGPLIKLFGTEPDGAVKLDLSVNRLSWRLTVESFGPSAFELDLVTTPLVGPNGLKVVPTIRVSGRAEAVGAAKDRPAELGVAHAKVGGSGLFYVDVESDSLAAAGTYTGAIELRPAKGASATARLTVTRTRSVPPVELKPPDPVHDSTFPMWQATEIDVSLKETSGRTVTLQRPEFVSLARKDGAAKEQAEAVARRVLDTRDQEVEFPLTLEPGAVRSMRVQLAPLRRPGEYTGLLRFSSPDYLALEQTVSVVKKHPHWFAALVIVAGISLSFAQRTYVSRTLPRKKQVRDASKLIVRLREALRASTS